MTLRWSRSRAARKRAGFTTVEMMVVVTIIAILAALGAPSMMDMIRTQRVKTASFDAFAGLVIARSEAIKRNTSVTLTPTLGGTDWSGGWTTTDSNGNVVARQDPFAGITFAGPASVTFTGLGRLSAAVAPFNLSAPSIPSTNYRSINIDLSGRPVSTQGAF